MGLSYVVLPPQSDKERFKSLENTFQSLKVTFCLRSHLSIRRAPRLLTHRITTHAQSKPEESQRQVQELQDAKKKQVSNSSHCSKPLK